MQKHADIGHFSQSLTFSFNFVHALTTAVTITIHSSMYVSMEGRNVTNPSLTITLRDPLIGRKDAARRVSNLAIVAAQDSLATLVLTMQWLQ